MHGLCNWKINLETLTSQDTHLKVHLGPHVGFRGLMTNN
jgi:hypothetical protein